MQSKKKGNKTYFRQNRKRKAKAKHTQQIYMKIITNKTKNVMKGE